MYIYVCVCMYVINNYLIVNFYYNFRQCMNMYSIFDDSNPFFIWLNG